MTAVTTLHPTKALDVEIIDLTPELAEAWLAVNVNNRNKKPQKIAVYARDMSRGNWRFTGEAIKFDTNGNLVDGQNRCYAVIESGATIKVLVVRGLEQAAQEVMDSGVGRTGADALHMHGIDRAKDVAATVAVHSIWGNGGFKHCMMKIPGYVRPSNAEVVQYAQSHPEILDAVRAVSPLRRTLAMPVGAIATAYLETAKVDADDCVEFFARVEGFRTQGKGDPINTLLKRSSEMRERREMLFPSTGLYMIFRAWNAYRSNASLQKFQLGSEGKWAAIPEPK